MDGRSHRSARRSEGGRSEPREGVARRLCRHRRPDRRAAPLRLGVPPRARVVDAPAALREGASRRGLNGRVAMLARLPQPVRRTRESPIRGWCNRQHGRFWPCCWRFESSPPSCRISRAGHPAPSSSGPGRRPLKAEAAVRIRSGLPRRRARAVRPGSSSFSFRRDSRRVSTRIRDARANFVHARCVVSGAAARGNRCGAGRRKGNRERCVDRGGASGNTRRDAVPADAYMSSGRASMLRRVTACTRAELLLTDVFGATGDVARVTRRVSRVQSDCAVFACRRACAFAIRADNSADARTRDANTAR